ncbi:hypothetical protein Tco_1177401 [Tanacetum coccineum]
MELQASAQSITWSDILSLYFWRAKEGDRRLARVINNVSVKLRVAIEEYQLFTQNFEASLWALEREVEERADEKMLFIEKLKGNVPALNKKDVYHTLKVMCVYYVCVFCLPWALVLNAL